MNMKFKTENTFEKRTAEAQRLRDKYKDRIPVIIEVASPHLKLDKAKYLIPFDISVGQFMFILRKRIKLVDEQALFLFFNNTLPKNTETIGSLYKNNRDRDGFMYGVLSLENTFG